MSIEHIKLKGSTHYRAVVYVNRIKRQKTFHRKVDALAWEVEQKTGRGIETLVSLEPLVPLKQPESPVTFGQLMERFEKDYSADENAHSTRIMNRSIYDNYLFGFSSAPLTEVSTEAIRSHLTLLRQENGISKGRVNRIRQLLHVMFNRAIEWNLVESNPISRIKKLRDVDYSDPNTIKYLTKEEVDILLDWVRVNSPWFYSKIVVLVFTGIRYGEMAALRVRDVRLNPKNPQLVICRSRCRHTGEFGPPKGKRTRILSIGPKLASFLETLVPGRGNDDPLLWDNWDDGRWTTRCANHFAKAIKATGISKISMHQLRHTYAVRYLENGGNIYDLKEMLGHREIKTTMRYSHFSPAMAERSRGVVDYESPAPSLAVIDGGKP